MHDLCTLDWLSQLEAVGVSALKIEGRLKSPAWTEEAVRIYRRALAGEPVEPLKQQAQRLTEYTGRAFTDGYLAGRRADLTGTDRGRQPRHEEISLPWAAEMEASLEHSAEASADEEVSAGGSGRTFRFLLSSRGPTISCHLWVDQVEVCWQYPKSVVHRAYRAISAGAVCEELQGCRIQGMLVESAVTDDPEFLLVRRTANAMVSRIAAELGRLQRAAARPITLTLPAESAISEAELVTASVNIRTLGDPPNGVRLHKTQLEEFVRHERQALLIVEGVEPEDVSWLVQVCRKQRPVVALPAVCFEEDLPAMRELVARCKKARLAVEVNSWGGWWIARRAGIAFETGPGLGVLNPLGAGMLRKLGARSVTVSLEADRRQLEDLCGAAPVGLSLYVFGRPVLATTRAEFPSEFQKRVLADRRGLGMTARHERGLWVFRPENAFDWRRLRNERIRVKNLVVDLVASPDPVGEWLHVLPRGGRGAFYFNYHRTLQ